MRLTEKKILAMALILALFLLLLIPALRFADDKPVLGGEMPYYHARMAEYIRDEGVPKEDDLVKRLDSK